MAKKIKRKKAGMMKRQQQKQNKKSQIRRKTASRAPARPTSQKELQKLLQRIPVLAFEPDLREFGFAPEVLQSALASGKSEPLIIADLVTPEFLQEFQQRLNQLEANTISQQNKNLMVKGVLYALSSNQMPHSINPLIVAIFLKSKAALEGKVFNPLELVEAVSAYEDQHSDLIEAMMEDMGGSKASGYGMEVSDSEEDQEDEEDSSDLSISLVSPELFQAYLDTRTDLATEAFERHQEDLELFLEDFLQEPLEEWEAHLVDRFLGEWFIQTANPLEEDVVSMQESLKSFVQYLTQQQQIKTEVGQAMLTLLNDPERYRLRLAR